MQIPELRIAIRKFPPFEEAIRKQHSNFVQETGHDCTLYFESLDLEPLTRSMFDEGGLKSGGWDIGFCVTDWMSMAKTEGHFLDLKPFITADPVPGYPDGWSKSLTGLQEVDDGIYGLPYHNGPQCLVYRKDLFFDESNRARFHEKTGRQLAVPETWDEYLEVVDFFSEPDLGRYGTVLAAYADGHNAFYDFTIHLWTRGGDLLDKAGMPSLNTPQAVAALDFYRALAKQDGKKIPPDPLTVDSVKSGEIFSEGNIALMTSWFGFAAFADSHISSRVRGLVDVAPIPRDSGPEGINVSLNLYWVLGIGAGSRHPDLAYAFIKHCMRPDMDRITTLEGGTGCRLSTWSDPEVVAQVPFYTRLQTLHEKARSLPSDKRLPDLARIIDIAVGKSISSDISSEEIMAQAQAHAEQIFIG
jgi:multiple sugar transport system substrate-binding protein